MPQPFTPRANQAVQVNPRVLEQRAACAIQIGMVAAAWTHVEDALIEMFAVATGETNAIEDGVSVTTFNAVSFATLTAIENLHLRLTVVKAAMAQNLPPPLQKDFEDLSADLRARAGERNNVVHAMWGIVDSYPNDVLRRVDPPPSPTWQRFTEKDLKAIVQRILTVAGKVHAFAAKVIVLKAKRRGKP